MKRPPDFSKSTDAIGFGLNIINRRENRERDKEWAPLVAAAEADLARIAAGKAPISPGSVASPALALVVDGDGIRFDYFRKNNFEDAHRVLLHNAVLLIWNDERRRKKLFKRCELEACNQFFFAKRRTGLYCCDQHRVADHNSTRGPKRREQDRKNYRIKTRRKVKR